MSQKVKANGKEKKNPNEYYCSDDLTCTVYELGSNDQYVEKSIKHVMCSNATVSHTITHNFQPNF